MPLLTTKAELLGRHYPLGPRCHFYQALHSRFISASISCVTTLGQDRNMDQRFIRGYARNRVNSSIHLPVFACGLLLEKIHRLLWRFTTSWEMSSSRASISWHTSDSEHSIRSGNFLSPRANNLEYKHAESAHDCYIHRIFTRCFHHRLRYCKNRDDFPRY